MDETPDKDEKAMKKIEIVALRNKCMGVDCWRLFISGQTEG